MKYSFRHVGKTRRRHSAGTAADVCRAGAGPGAASAGRRMAGGDPGLAGQARRSQPRATSENSAELFICVKAASVHVPGMVGKLSVAGRGGGCSGRLPARPELKVRSPRAPGVGYPGSGVGAGEVARAVVETGR